MIKIKRALSVARTAYTGWLFSSRLLIFGFVFMFEYVYFIHPLLEISKVLNTPLNVLEPFCILVNNQYFVPLLVIGYIVLIADFPRLDDSAAFILIRTGKIPWVVGQMIFLFLAALTYLLFTLLSSMVFVASESFMLNAWSIAVKTLGSPSGEELLALYPSVRVDLSVIMQARPYTAAVHGICLIMLFMVTAGLIQMVFALIRKKVISVFINLVICAAGLILLILKIWLKWCFPISNAVFGWHYDDVFNETNFPIEGSYLYFGGVITVLAAAVIFIAKRCSFHITGGTE